MVLLQYGFSEFRYYSKDISIHISLGSINHDLNYFLWSWKLKCQFHKWRNFFSILLGQNWTISDDWFWSHFSAVKDAIISRGQKIEVTTSTYRKRLLRWFMMSSSHLLCWYDYCELHHSVFLMIWDEVFCVLDAQSPKQPTNKKRFFHEEKHYYIVLYTRLYWRLNFLR